WRSGEADPQALQRRGMQALMTPGVSPEYLALVDEQMRPVARVDARTVVVIAARVGTTRLIDNVVLGEGVAGDVSVRAAGDPRADAPGRPVCDPKDAAPAAPGLQSRAH